MEDGLVMRGGDTITGDPPSTLAGGDGDWCDDVCVSPRSDEEVWGSTPSVRECPEISDSAQALEDSIYIY